jgi:uncharacterized radical SAM superfamily protein
MIKTVNGSGRYIMVNGGYPATTYINTSSGYMNVGDVRYNTQMQRLEVYDGQMWLEINTSHASIGLTPDAEMALDWAIKKKNEDMVLEAKAKDNPAIADLLNQRKTIDDQIKMIEILTKDNKVGTN